MDGDAASRWKEMILDHYKNPRHFGAPESSRWHAEEHNRTCGDRIEVYGFGSEDHISFRFTGSGCSLCIASASLMCSLLQNVDRAASEKAVQDFQTISTQGLATEAGESWQLLDALRQYPVRSRCVRLPWQALQTILNSWPADSSEVK